MVKNLSILFIILLFSGCSSSKKIVVSESLDAVPEIAGSVLNASAMQKGGTLVLGAFKPGPGAEANDETDQLSWMMVKGIKDTLPEDNTHFTVTTDMRKDADYYLDGFIEDYGRRGHMAHLSVDGEIWLRDTGEKIFVFQTSTNIDIKNQNPKTVAYQIGVAVAHYVATHNQPLVDAGGRSAS